MADPGFSSGSINPNGDMLTYYLVKMLQKTASKWKILDCLDLLDPPLAFVLLHGTKRERKRLPIQKHSQWTPMKILSFTMNSPRTFSVALISVSFSLQLRWSENIKFWTLLNEKRIDGQFTLCPSWCVGYYCWVCSLLTWCTWVREMILYFARLKTSMKNLQCASLFQREYIWVQWSCHLA